jgi:hypothetical protein
MENMARMKECPWCSNKIDEREFVSHVLKECGQKPELEESDVSENGSRESGEVDSTTNTEVSLLFALC